MPVLLITVDVFVFINIVFAPIGGGSSRHFASVIHRLSELPQRIIKSMSGFQFRDCTKLTSSWGYSWPNCGLGTVSRPLRLTARRFCWIIDMHGRRAGHCRNRATGAHLRSAGHQTAEPERSRGCESQARRNACAESVVSTMAAVWRLLPNRVADTPARPNRGLDAARTRTSPSSNGATTTYARHGRAHQSAQCQG